MQLLKLSCWGEFVLSFKLPVLIDAFAPTLPEVPAEHMLVAFELHYAYMRSVLFRTSFARGISDGEVSTVEFDCCSRTFVFNPRPAVMIWFAISIAALPSSTSGRKPWASVVLILWIECRCKQVPPTWRKLWSLVQIEGKSQIFNPNM